MCFFGRCVVDTATTTTSGDAPSASSAPSAGKILRADAQRNRDGILEAAVAAFTVNGTDASLEDIARRAGVGIGTLYRHFPTRDALVEAAYRRGVEQVCDSADRLLVTHPPAEALELWMTDFVDYVATKRGLAATLKQADDKNAELFAHMRARIQASLEKLVRRAAYAGQIRADVDSVDLLRALGGVCMVSDSADWQAQALRLVKLLVDGLRYGAPASAVR